MVKRKLTVSQLYACECLTDKPQSAYSIGVNLATMKLLVKLGYAKDVMPPGPGAMFNPRTHYQFVRNKEPNPDDQPKPTPGEAIAEFQPNARNIYSARVECFEALSQSELADALECVWRKLRQADPLFRDIVIQHPKTGRGVLRFRIIPEKG